MAAHSRHTSPETSHHAHTQTDSEPSPNVYEQERERRKKALHDRVELALLEFGFGETAKLRGLFTGERSTVNLLAQTSQPRKRRKRGAATPQQERRRSARNVVKKNYVPPATSPSEGCGKKVCYAVHPEM